MKRKYSITATLVGYAVAYVGGFIITYLLYYDNIAGDFGGIIVMPVLIWVACLLLNTEHWSSKWFVAIMATLVSNILTFFICGPIISLIDKAPDPYSIGTISLFIGLKVALLILLFTLYKKKLRDRVWASINILDGELSNSLSIALVSFLGFCMINAITDGIGITPTSLIIRQLDQVIKIGNVELNYNIIVFYGIISIIFVFWFWQILSTVSRSTNVFKTKTGLNVARKIQQDMLPRELPALSNRPEFEIHGSMHPAKEVGGDFYDFFLVNENTLAIIIADVSDKGVPAALYMAITKTIIKSSAISGKNPKEVFETVNNILCENNETGMFVTAFLGYLDISSGKFVYVNAGHNLPLLRSKNGNSSGRRFEWLKADAGFVLAGMKDTFYKMHEISLKPGDEIFLYTDGVTEAINREEELFGDRRLFETVNSCVDLPLSELILSAKLKIDKFASGTEQADDITMLALRY
ncbi:MAG: PP2C family protein-serine/threonine phosphatase [Prevotellaceae bacterium]|nr:PP2C family protein-serine/threonine phosphatase [Prevotellaceae bacterium]